MATKKSFRPQTLRGILVFLLILVTLAGGGLFYLGLEKIREYSIKVNHRLIDAEASSKQIESLQILKAQLLQSNTLVTKAEQLFTTPAKYQTQAYNDVRRYATAARLSVETTKFSEASSGENTITVKFDNPVNYDRLIHFLSNIESNLPKMQVISIDIGPEGSATTDNVRVGEIKIKVSVK